MPSRLLLAGACVAALVSAGPAGAGSEKPVQDTAMEAMMQAQGFGHSPSRWEAQGMPATMDAHEAVTEKLLNLMPRVGDLYSKMPDFKVPSGPMVPEELDPKKVPIDFTQPPPMVSVCQKMGGSLAITPLGRIFKRHVRRATAECVLDVCG